ncbi:hypothetical protein FQN54_006070 [Arachnomyces sp. PD_36]|nr:hypothetical protein FQN54_006070 [Arachnomyces sp. PD_36]
MRLTTLIAAAALSGLACAENHTYGFHVSSADTDVDFEGAYESGARYVSIRVTEGLNTVDELASKHWEEATKAGLLTQAYHSVDFRQLAKDQLDFFLKNGGDFDRGNSTLPACFELLPNPDAKGDPCYGLESGELSDWVRDLGVAYFSKYDSVTPTLRVNSDWWDNCTYSQDLQTYKLERGAINYESDKIPESHNEYWFYKYWEYAPHYEFGGRAALYIWDYEQLKALTSRP